uniref:Uncharacterized protein n=1 Tax=Ananas comosus var. bracteatus TaxID=296719 RepID=A0A6V7NW28_ANACO|nr:unnamed protein product [Ananas comosus var. bracteatus]
MAVGSLEEKVQRLVKTWEMEMVHKIRPEDWKTVNPDKFRFSVNDNLAAGAASVRPSAGVDRVVASDLHNSLPARLRPRDTAGLQRPPKIVYKFRHWGYFEGPSKGMLPPVSSRSSSACPFSLLMMRIGWRKWNSFMSVVTSFRLPQRCID